MRENWGKMAVPDPAIVYYSCHSPPKSIDQGHDTLSKSQLIQEQQTDPEISKLIFRALPEDEISQVPMCYYIKNGILMRKWRPFDVPADDEWAVYHQNCGSEVISS